MSRRFCILAIIVAVLLNGCAQWERDPLAVYGFDPKATEMPAITFGVLPF